MGATIQVKLSDDEEKIVQRFKMKHDLKSDDEAVRQIVSHYNSMINDSDGSWSCPSCSIE